MTAGWKAMRQQQIKTYADKLLVLMNIVVISWQAWSELFRYRCSRVNRFPLLRSLKQHILQILQSEGSMCINCVPKHLLQLAAA